MSTTTLKTVCRYSCTSPNWRPRRASPWPSSAFRLSMAMRSAPGMRGSSRWRATVDLPTLPEKLMTAIFIRSSLGGGGGWLSGWRLRLRRFLWRCAGLRQLLPGGSVGTSFIDRFLFRDCSAVRHPLLSSCSGCTHADRYQFSFCMHCAQLFGMCSSSALQRPFQLLDSGSNPANQDSRTGNRLPPWMSAEIGAVAPVVRHAHPEVITCLEAVMETQSRERISIDLQGLKPALLARSQAQGVSPSELVRKALEQALGAPAEAEQGADHRPHLKRSGDRARLCLRMERDGAMALLAAAHPSALTPPH